MSLAAAGHLLRADARANHARILAAALDVFRERGVDAEMKDVAARASVSIGTLYRNFPTRDALVAAMFGDCHDRLEDLLSRALAQPDAVEGIRVLFEGGFVLAEEKGLMMDLLQRGMPARCAAPGGDQNPISRVAALLERGVASGGLRAGLDVEVAAARLLSSFDPHGYSILRRSRSPEEIAAAHLALFLYEVGAREPEQR